MESSERIRLLKRLNEYEVEFPIDQWKVEDIDVWPLIKTLIFFLIFKNSNYSESEKNSIWFKFIGKIKSSGINLVTYLSSVYYLILFRPKEAKIVFSGASTHRVIFNGQNINRYYQLILEYIKGEKINYEFFEYQSSGQQNVNSSHVYKLLPFFKKKQSLKLLMNDSGFKNFLDRIEIDTGLKKEQFLKGLKKKIENVNSWANLYEYIFNKTKAKYSLGLCYYSDPMFGMNLAASRLGVESIDFQHGTQGPMHFAYTYNVPSIDGFNTLPKQFWCWDQESGDHLKSWISNQETVKIVGNPWVEYVTDSKFYPDLNLPEDKPIVLFTHQPIKPALDVYLLETIRSTKDRFNWWLRVHPRISSQEFDELKTLISEWGLDDVIELNKASNYPLPFLLNKVAVHISKYSGSIIEGVLCNTPTIILEEIGINSFGNFIESKLAHGLLNPTTIDLAQLVIQLVEKKYSSGNKTQMESTIKGVLDEIIK
ncbi:hypothetical protein [Shivajiella indica]|uniref:Uncharacterized protein n=1 Tax=Shivajiella indica TaxID=872115 RepID=A0ABW5BCY2_9BACT